MGCAESCKPRGQDDGSGLDGDAEIKQELGADCPDDDGLSKVQTPRQRISRKESQPKLDSAKSELAKQKRSRFSSSWFQSWAGASVEISPDEVDSARKPQKMVVTDAVLAKARFSSNVYWGAHSPFEIQPEPEQECTQYDDGPLSLELPLLSDSETCPFGSECSPTTSPMSFEPLQGEDVESRSPISSRCPKKRMCTQLQLIKLMEVQTSQRMQLIIENTRNINDFYDFEVKILGKGAFGTVHKGFVKSTTAARAVKSISKQRMGAQVDALKKEMRITKMVDHPNIIKLYEIFEDRPNIYLVMEICYGGMLSEHLTKATRFSEGEAALTMRQILCAVHYLHEQRICHRDLKPDNFLMLNWESMNRNSLKIADFGLSCSFSPGQVLKALTGSPAFMAPEVFDRCYDHVCDIWSCGVILYLLLSGKRPFRAKSAAELSKVIQRRRFAFGPLWVDASEDSMSLINSALIVDPQKRLSARQFLDSAWVSRKAPPPRVQQLSDELVQNLRYFRSQNKFKRAALCVVASLLADEQTRECREAFAALDIDGDGFISVSEMRKGLKARSKASAKKRTRRLSLDVSEIMQAETPDLETEDVSTIMQVAETRQVHQMTKTKSDQTQTLELAYTEFLAATFSRHTCCSDDVCWAAFKVFDQDGDGFITKDELASGAVLGRLTEDEVAQLVQDLDDNGDGQIDFQEFVYMMKNNS